MARRFTPGVADCVFVLVLVSVLIGGRHGMLNDPGTLWHYRLGQEILKTGRVTHVDDLTYTTGKAHWIDQYWLYDASLAFVVDHGGWSAAVALSSLMLATIYTALAAGLTRDGFAPMAVLLVTMLAAGVGSIHFLVRPHLFTLAFFLVSLQLCRDQHKHGGWRVFGMIPLMVLWANIHGGFVAGPVIVGSAAIGHAISGPWDRVRQREIAKFLVASGLCVLAALINPYGIGLYRHVVNLLVTSGVTDLIDEYQPIPFGKPTARAVELVVVALIAVPTFSKRRVSRYDLVQLLIWLHLSLSAVRNAPLFALAVAPGLCEFFGPATEPSTAPKPRPILPPCSLWPGVIAVGLMIAGALGASIGSFDPSHWPLAALPTLNTMPANAPLFHEQDWGGLIEAETNPVRRAFLDDRFELYGRDRLLKYLNAIEGGPDWDELSTEYTPALVWVRPTRRPRPPPRRRPRMDRPLSRWGLGALRASRA